MDFIDITYNPHSIPDALNAASQLCHCQASEMGWWDAPREYGTLLMLMVSELAEAMEGIRKGIADDHLPHRSMLEVELADTLIRIFDFAGHLGLDLGGAVAEKLAYNRTRADHSRAARAAEGGKKW